MSEYEEMTEEMPRGAEDGSRSGPGEEPSDRSLLRRIRRGNQDAASLLYHRYAHRLRALVRARRSPDLASRVDHEDIVQSVFKSFFRGVSRGSYDVPDGEELWHLFLVITLNKVRAKGVFHRAAKRDVRLTVGDEEIDKYAECLKTDRDAYLLLKLAVEEALERLPPQHKLVTQLRMEGDDVAEIARKTGRSKRSVERILQECREKLGQLLGET
jgi:RNA polymerase sigma-70 factor, ECF subfamily